MAHMEPAAARSAALKDELIEVGMGNDEPHPSLRNIHSGRNTGARRTPAPHLTHGDAQIGRFAHKMLAAHHSAHSSVEGAAAITAVDVDGLLGKIAKGLKHGSTEGTEVRHNLGAGSVVDVESLGSSGAGELQKLKVFGKFHKE